MHEVEEVVEKGPTLGSERAARPTTVGEIKNYQPYEEQVL